MGSRTPQRPVLCNCRVAGCGSSTTWCPSRLENILGRLIPKALCARHRHLDKSSRYLEGFTDDSKNDYTSTSELDTVNDTDNFGVKVPDNKSHLCTCSNHKSGTLYSCHDRDIPPQPSHICSCLLAVQTPPEHSLTKPEPIPGLPDPSIAFPKW